MYKCRASEPQGESEMVAAMAVAKTKRKTDKFWDGKSFGLSKDLKIPEFEDEEQAARVTAEAIAIFAKVLKNDSEEYDQDSFEDARSFLLDNAQYIDLIISAFNGNHAADIWVYHAGLKYVAEQLYENKAVAEIASGKRKPKEKKGPELDRQRRQTMRNNIKKYLGGDVTPTGTWSVTHALVYIGMVGCSIADRDCSTRPFLPLVGAMMLVYYKDILIKQPGESLSRRQIEELGWDELSLFNRVGYFDK